MRRRAVVVLALALCVIPGLAEACPHRGDDTLVGTPTADSLHGGHGEDALYGHGAADELSGGQGHDYIEGGRGDDVIHGGKDADYIKGGAGEDTCWVTRRDIARGCEVLLAPPFWIVDL